MTTEQAIQRSVAQFRRLYEQTMADANRKYETDALLNGADPDQIDCALDAFAPTAEARRREIEVEIENIIRTQLWDGSETPSVAVEPRVSWWRRLMFWRA